MDDSEPEGINRKGAAEPQPSRSDSRKGFDRELSGTAQGRAVSFRPKGEIFLKSLTSARDDGPWPVTSRRDHKI